MRSARRKLPLCVLAMLVLTLSAVSPQEKRVVRHPNLLLNREEIEAIRQKIQRHEWCAALFRRVQALADEPGVHPERNLRETALAYAITGQQAYGEKVRQLLVHQARAMLPEYEKLQLRLQPEFGAWGPWGVYAWAYDLCYDRFNDSEREVVERWLRTAARTIIEGEKLWTTTPNLVFDKHCRVGLVGYCLGDKELIDWALHDRGAHGPGRGGFYAVLDAMIKDGHFWGEAPIYALHYDVHGMLALAEAARHYDGTNLYDYVSPRSKASIRSILDGYLRLAFPLERTGIGRGSIRLATYGDGSTSYSPAGTLQDTFLANPPSRPAPGEILGELEIAYRHFRDPGYAWFLHLNPSRDHAVTYGRAVWGWTALTHGLPLPEQLQPPPAPSGVYPSQGLAMLRADESPRYWTSGALAAVLRLGTAVGHGHEDYYSLIFHAKGRLLYPDLNVIQYEPTYLGYTHEGIAHNTLLVDYQSPRPGRFTTQQEFAPEVKYFTIHGSAFEDVEQSRTLLLTREYLLDVFHAQDQRGRERVFDWVMHGLGRLYPGRPGSYEPSQELVPYYWWVDNERSRRTDAAWQVDWIQQSAGVTPGLQPLGKEWFEESVGVRLTMLGWPGTQVFCGDAPITDGPPYHRIEGHPEGSSPVVVVRRRTSATTFVALHEPYTDAPTITSIRRLDTGKDNSLIAVQLHTSEFTDYLLLSLLPDKERELTTPNGEALRFRNYAYLRLAGDQLVGRGGILAFRLRAAKQPRTVRLNGNEAIVQYDGGLVAYGSPPQSLPKKDAEQQASDLEPAERRAYVHAWFLPEEVHLPEAGERQVPLYLRSVGEGAAHGTYRVLTPPEISVEPPRIEVPALRHGQSHIVQLRVRASPQALRRLENIVLQPEGDAPLASVSLPVSVGVVIREDRRLPRLAQFVIRAPGYTMRVDHFSGVSYYLLDGDGHRRHGRIHNTNFINGFPGVQRGENWCFRYRMPCRFVWRGPNTLTVGCDGWYNDGDARLQYTFHAERIEIGLVPPTRPDAEHTVWLGNFDVLLPPLHNGNQHAPHEPIVADRFYFPHPVHRQGVLLSLPERKPLRYLGTAVSFPLRAGQKLVLQFATPDEAKKQLLTAQAKPGQGESAAGVEITVAAGPGDSQNTDDRRLQQAIDQVAEQGGGQVRLGPGRYVLRNSLRLRDKVSLLGVPGQTVLVPHSWKVVPLAEDARAGSREITLAEAADFQVGDGVAIRDDQTSGFAITTATVVAQIGPKKFRLSQPLVHDYRVARRARVARLFPLVSGSGVAHALIEGITLEGRKQLAPFYQFADGCRVAAIYLYQCQDVTIRRCLVRDFPGDGISFQWQSRHITVEDCVVENNNVFGVHPGSDSRDSLVRRNQIVGNGGPGLFVCVGVRQMRFEANQIHRNRGPGISIGCHDTDNVFLGNVITENGRGGVLFRDDRDDRGQPAGAHRNRFEKNVILDNFLRRESADSPATELPHGISAGVIFQGTHNGVVLRENVIGYSKPTPNNAAIVILGQAPELTLERNQFRHVQHEVLRVK